MNMTDGAVQGKGGIWKCHECSASYMIPRFTAFFSVVKCCGRSYDLQNWDNPYTVDRAGFLKACGVGE